MSDSIRQSVSGWGRYPIQECQVYRPGSVRELKQLLQARDRPDCIAYGMGRSYGDASLNGHQGVIALEQLNRFLDFDPERGVLECEGGVTIGEIVEHCLPRGFFPSVTPGTQQVTVGGAIANDVHGKNHHQDGCFSQCVLDFRLLLASGEIVECSRDRHSELFWATVGGIGLTGIIVSARLRLLPVESSYVKVHYQKAANLEEALTLFASGDGQYRYSVAWIDCLAKGRSLGRSVLMRGDHASRADLSATPGIGNPLEQRAKRKLRVPSGTPGFLLNRFSVGLFNAAYYASYRKNTTRMAGVESFFYPLDAISHWNRLYGRAGFVQYQAVLPADRSQEGLTALLERISRSALPSFLAVLKSSGPRNQGLLSFPIAGHTLALDIPVKGGAVFSMLRELDELVLRYGGRVYLAKDAVLSPETFRLMYADTLDAFIRIKQEADPHHCWSSSMSRRLGLTGG